MSEKRIWPMKKLELIPWKKQCGERCPAARADRAAGIASKSQCCRPTPESLRASSNCPQSWSSLARESAACEICVSLRVKC